MTCSHTLAPVQDDDGAEEYWPRADMTQQELATFDETRRVLGVTERELVQVAARWWDRTGRYLIRNPDFKDAAVGFPSGITRGLTWGQLRPLERQKVTLACWRHRIVPTLEAGKSLEPLHRGE